VVDGVTYNVTFDPGSYSSVYAATPTFLGNEPGAQAAAIALAAALQSLDVTGIAGISSSYTYQELDIPYQLEGGVVFVEQAVLFPPWTAPYEQGFSPSRMLHRHKAILAANMPFSLLRPYLPHSHSSPPASVA
jgi:hypothetical protein